MNEKTERSFNEVLEKVKEFTAVDVAKLVATGVVHHCVAAVVVTIAHNLMPTTTRKEKIQLYIAARAVSGMVADKASERIERKLDKVEEFVMRIVKPDKTWTEATSNVSEEPVQEEPTEQ